MVEENETEHNLAQKKKYVHCYKCIILNEKPGFGGAKLNGVNCRTLMDKNEEIINSIRDIFIEMNKDTVSENNMNIYCKEYKQILTKMDNAYRCMRTLTITDDLITKTKDHICKTMLLWRKLKIPVTPSAHLFEDHIVYQMKNIVDGLADKVKIILKELIKMVNVVKENVVE